MTRAFRLGSYNASLATTASALRACQELRHRSFYGCDGVDADAFDPACDHMQVRHATTGQLVCTFRMQHFASGAAAAAGYAGQRYDLRPLAEISAPVIEIGRFCTAPDVIGADVLRVAWAALARIVDDKGAAMLFGCTSFAGTDPSRYADAFRLLADRYVGPDPLRPGRLAPETIPLDHATGQGRDGVHQLPPLLKTYLGMGGWVSDHAVIDHDMQTLHVFTAVTIADIPAGRARALRALAAQEN